MKIAVSGVAGAGKSTLCRLISDKMGLDYMPDLMDTVLNEMGYETGAELNTNLGEKGLIDWYISALERKVKEDCKLSRFIADKSVLDHGARWYARKFSSATEDHYNKVDDLLRQGIGNYSTILFLPLSDRNRSAHNNGMRDVDNKHRELIDLTIRGLARRYSANLVEYDFDFSISPEDNILKLKQIIDASQNQ